VRAANILYLGIKELRSLYRDPIMLALTAFAFTGAVYPAATAIPETLHKAPIAIVDEDQSPLSLRITNAFYPPLFTLPEMVTPAQIDARMDAGVTLDIPPDFQRDMLAGRKRASSLPPWHGQCRKLACLSLLRSSRCSCFPEALRRARACRRRFKISCSQPRRRISSCWPRRFCIAAPDSISYGLSLLRSGSLAQFYPFLRCSGSAKPSPR
jgi:hypothetical protein